MKKIITCTLVSLLLVILATPLAAKESNLPNILVAPHFEQFVSEPLRLQIIERAVISKALVVGNTLTAQAYTEGRSNATSVWVRVDLYRRSVSTVAWVKWKTGTARNDPTGDYVSAQEVWALGSGYDYKVVSTHTAYAGVLKETVYCDVEI